MIEEGIGEIDLANCIRGLTNINLEVSKFLQLYHFEYDTFSGLLELD